MISPPVLSTYDPVVDREGSVDPLGLGVIYERLADRLLPSLTRRMRKVGLLIPMCAAARVCSSYGPDDVASDKVTPPWLVFEWLTIEALVRRKHDDESEDALGIPGAQKVGAAVLRGRAIGHSTYLKTAKVFGYTGILRRLATGQRILGDSLLIDDGADPILRAWEKDRDLDGFITGTTKDSGRPGVHLRVRLVDAIKRAMACASTASQPGSLWGDIAAAFDPSPAALGRRERAAIVAALRATSSGVGVGRQPGYLIELIEALEQGSKPVVLTAEPTFLRQLGRRRPAGDLAQVIAAIDAYEALCWPVLAAFDLTRFLSSKHGYAMVDASAFAADRLASTLVDAMRKGVERVRNDGMLGSFATETERLLAAFRDVRSSADLHVAVIRHHQATQRDKPPDGARCWFDAGRREDEVAIRPTYALTERPSGRPAYIHGYRIATLSNMLMDLRRLS